MSNTLQSTYDLGEQLADDPIIWVVDDFVTASECRDVIRAARNKLSRAKVSRLGSNTQSNKRTNRVAWLPHDYDDTVRAIVERVSEFVGLPADHAESLQVIHYAKNEEYRPHFDAWDVGTDKGKEKTEQGGNRILTALIYLNSVARGGGTGFPKLDVEVAAKTGRMCIFHDLVGEGPERHPKALHAGMPVKAGEKWACNLWFRERPYPRGN